MHGIRAGCGYFVSGSIVRIFISGARPGRFISSPRRNFSDTTTRTARCSIVNSTGELPTSSPSISIGASGVDSIRIFEPRCSDTCGIEYMLPLNSRRKFAGICYQCIFRMVVRSSRPSSETACGTCIIPPPLYLQIPIVALSTMSFTTSWSSTHMRMPVEV